MGKHRAYALGKQDLCVCVWALSMRIVGNKVGKVEKIGWGYIWWALGVFSLTGKGNDTDLLCAVW